MHHLAGLRAHDEQAKRTAKMERVSRIRASVARTLPTLALVIVGFFIYWVALYVLAQPATI